MFNNKKSMMDSNVMRGMANSNASFFSHVQPNSEYVNFQMRNGVGNPIVTVGATGIVNPFEPVRGIIDGDATNQCYYVGAPQIIYKTPNYSIPQPPNMGNIRLDEGMTNYEVSNKNSRVVLTFTLKSFLKFDDLFDIIRSLLSLNTRDGSKRILEIIKEKYDGRSKYRSLDEDELSRKVALILLSQNNIHYSKHVEYMSEDISVNFELYCNKKNAVDGPISNDHLSIIFRAYIGDNNYPNSEITLAYLSLPLGIEHLVQLILADELRNDTNVKYPTTTNPRLSRYNIFKYKDLSPETICNIFKDSVLFLDSLPKNINFNTLCKEVSVALEKLVDSDIKAISSIWFDRSYINMDVENVIHINYCSKNGYLCHSEIDLSHIIEYKEIKNEDVVFKPVTFSTICYNNIKRDFNMLMLFINFVIESYKANEEKFKEMFKEVIIRYKSIDRFAVDAGIKIMHTVYSKIVGLKIDGFLGFTLKYTGDEILLSITDKATGKEFDEISLSNSLLENGIMNYIKFYTEPDQFDISDIKVSNINYDKILCKNDCIINLIKSIILHNMEAYTKIYEIFASLKEYSNGDIFKSVNDIVNYILEYGTINDVFDILHKSYAKLNNLIISIKDKSINVELIDIKGDTYKMCIFEHKELFITEELVSDIIDSESNNSLEDIISKIYELATINGIENRDHESIKEALKKSIYSSMINQDDRDCNVESYIINNYLNHYINGIDYELGNDGLIKVTFRATSADLEGYVRTISVYHVLLLMKQN